MTEKRIRYKDGTWLMPGGKGHELYLHPPKVFKVPNAPENLDMYMARLDKEWRKLEGRKPVDQLTEREQMLEGRIPWDPVRLKELTAISNNL